MKNLNTSFLKLPLLLLLLTLGCSKDRIKPLQIPTAPVAPAEEDKEVFLANPTDIFKTLKETPTIKTITDDSQWPFVGAKGTKLYGSRYSFRFPNGTSADYPIEIQLIELFSPKDMILAEMPTVSDGRLLTTAGEINVRAFKDGIELKLNPYSGFRILVPASLSDDAMRLFYGEEPVGDVVNWKEASFKDSSRFEQGRFPISWLDSMSSYQLFPAKIGWINCDKFASYLGAKTKVKFKSELPGVSALKKFIYFPALKSLSQIYSEESLEVPVGEAIKVICFAEKTDGKVFMEIQETTVSSGMTVGVKVVEVSKQALLDALAGL